MEDKNERIATLEKEMEEHKAAIEEQKAENMRWDAEYNKKDDQMEMFMNEMRAKLPSEEKVHVLPNNFHLTRPICSFCEKRCTHK
ncbi:predicted protein [Arabidopsis lyrata subsp. lyrata]|uniref:Predicted protein n=1 Tax=Arabidopsis lyrata subsp. lyrata TaxID=81972 RepID=D7LYQ2_ARALL|nr:predicted protein [Arabidopsis lyrata subsp. lyrata]